MKKYLIELVVLCIQVLIFYILPLFTKPEDVMGMVFLMIVLTFILSIIVSSISKNKIKYLYPIMVSILFIPSIYIYYNDSAQVHSIWYCIVSLLGICIGTIINRSSKNEK